MFSLEEQQRLAISQLPRVLSYEYVVKSLTGIEGVKEPDNYSRYSGQVQTFVRNGKAIKLPIDIHFDYCLIMFDISPFMKTKDLLLFKLGSIMYRFLVDFGQSIQYAYEGLLCGQEDYLLQNIEEADCSDIEDVEMQKQRLDDFLQEKKIAYDLHDKLLLRYDNLGISRREWRNELDKIVKRRPQYARLIASFKALMQYEKYEYMEDFLAFNDGNDDRRDIPAFCYIPSEYLDEALQQESECGCDYYYATVGKKRKIYDRLSAFCNEFNDIYKLKHGRLSA